MLASLSSRNVRALTEKLETLVNSALSCTSRSSSVPVEVTVFCRIVPTSGSTSA